MLSIPADAGGPLLLVVFGAIAIIFNLVIVFFEALVMWRLGWNGWWRSLLASLLCNFSSAILGVMLMLLILDAWPFALLIFVSWLLTVVVEGGILMLMKANATHENVRTSLIINVLSYLLILLPLFYLGEF